MDRIHNILVACGAECRDKLLCECNGDVVVAEELLDQCDPCWSEEGHMRGRFFDDAMTNAASFQL